MTLTINLKDFQGPVLKSATIFSNDPQKPQISLNLHGSVRPHIELRPGPLVQFWGTKDREQEKEIDLLTSAHPFKILRIENTLGEKIFYQLETLVKERHYRLKIFNRQKTVSYSGKLTCFTNHPEKQEIRIVIRSIADR